MELKQEAAEFIKQFEGFTPIAKWDENAFRIGYGSDTITLPNGTYRKVVSGDTTTPELAKIDLARRIDYEFIPRAKKQIGSDAWDRLPNASKVALLSLSYNYGSITKQLILSAAKEGNVTKLAKAIVDSTYNDNAKLSEGKRNALRSRRAKEAQYALTDLGGKNNRLLTSGKNRLPYIIVGIVLILIIVLLFIYRKKIIAKLT